jgi:hypothetical protein
MFSVSLIALALIQAASQEPRQKLTVAMPAVAAAQRVPHPDESESFELVFALLGGGGTSAQSAASWFGGLKIGAGCCTRGTHPNEKGGTITLDLGYDRVGSSDGLSAEISAMIPVVRFPRPRRETANYLRVYAEPGVGVRTGGDGGAYVSGKVMIAWLSDERIFKAGNSPFLEIQGRFALGDTHHHDIRILAGAIVTFCRHCGLD